MDTDVAVRFLELSKEGESSISLQLMFEGPLRLDADAVTRSLRAYDPRTRGATCEVLDAENSVMGLIEWGDHIVRILAFDAPLPDDVVEWCLGPAPFAPERKPELRRHASHALLFYSGSAQDPLQHYVALAAVAGALHGHGASLVLNESARACFPCEALASRDSDMWGLLESLPIPVLYVGFVKYDIEGILGPWMRTYAAEQLGLPDFAYHASGHHESQEVNELFSNLFNYLRSSGAEFAPGHTMQVGEDEFLRLRAPAEGEYWLDTSGEMLVLEKISGQQINR